MPETAARHLAVAVRQFVILALATWGLVAITNPLVWMPLAFVQGFTVFNFTVLLHEVVHHTVFDAGVPAPSARSAGCTRCRAASPRASSRAGISITTPSSVGRGRSEAPPPVAEDQRALVQAAVLLAGAVPDLLPRGAAGERRRIRPRCSGGSRCERRVSIAAHLAVLARSGRRRRRRGVRAPTSCRCSSSSRSRSR